MNDQVDLEECCHRASEWAVMDYEKRIYLLNSVLCSLQQRKNDDPQTIFRVLDKCFDGLDDQQSLLAFMQEDARRVTCKNLRQVLRAKRVPILRASMIPPVYAEIVTRLLERGISVDSRFRKIGEDMITSGIYGTHPTSYTFAPRG